ncbi:HNH endonuclease [Arthrobacter phage Aoka]|nr:HNH endonuclease [Arthrobacter phage Aoka]
MPWLRIGDTAANHPIALAVLEAPDADDRLLNEVFGFVTRCALQSTAHLTDYVISRGTAIQIGGHSRVWELLDAAIDAGYLSPTEIDVDGVSRPAYKLLDDPDFIHMRTREEIEWERQRKTDNSNPALIVPVRLRDGDACRYCGLVVDFRPGQRKGRIAGTYDHREPGQAATVETYVVACRACNATRGDSANADAVLPLLPEPTKPYYSAHTIEWLRTNDWAKRNGIKPPRKGKAIAPGNPARKGEATPANGSTTGPAPEINGSSDRISTGETRTNNPGNGAHAAQEPAKDAPPPDAPRPEKEALTRANTGSGRNPQIPQNGRLQDLETPGRVGSGRVGSVVAGPPGPATTTQQHKQTHNTGRSRPRTRKGTR